MRTFEIILVVLLVLTWISMLFSRLNRFRILKWLPLLAAVAALVQLLVEKFRWQMTLLYALDVLFLLLSVPRLFGKTGQPFRNLAIRILVGTGKVLGSILMILAIALPNLFPMFDLPKPTGQFAVGTTTFEWVDSSRPETITADPSDYRDLLVQVWYPADKTAKAKPLPMWPSAFDPYFAKANSLPSFTCDPISLIPSHTYAELPVNAAQATYPVLVFSHAYIPGFMNQNLVQMEELASQGYVIFSVAHPYESAAIFYPDGRIVDIDQARFKTIASEMGGSMDAMKQYIAADDPVEKENAFRQYLNGVPTLQESTGIWAQDVIFAMDQIERLNQGEIQSQFSGRLDIERMGVFGMSLGGAVAGEVCMLDSRCKAGANLDGFQVGNLIDGKVTRPFFMMSSARNAGINNVILDRFQGKFHLMVVKDSSHFNYADFQLVSPLFQLIGATGSINPYRMETILNSYLVGFFNTYLRGEHYALLDGPSPTYPEVEYTVREGK